jgi:hypothetical protein
LRSLSHAYRQYSCSRQQNLLRIFTQTHNFPHACRQHIDAAGSVDDESTHILRNFTSNFPHARTHATRADNILTRQVQSTTNPQRARELRDKLKESGRELKSKTNDNDTLKAEADRLGAEFDALVTAQGTYPLRITEMMELVAFCKDKIRKYQIRHNRDHKFMRVQQAEVVDVEKECQRMRKRARDIER